MEEVRQLVAEEGREARNLVAFHVAVDTPPRISRKPPRSISGASSVVSTLRRSESGLPTPTRLRSASAGRDKRAELQARYWALLFGNLQRAIGEIYTTVESHENLSECQEVILVLENYTRDFKALCEWFRLKWEYDNTPPPQRPQSLAWEVRKTDFVRPESRRTHSVKSSPSVSGKNSPSLSGHNTPSGKNSPSLSTGKSSPGSGKISPRVYGSIASPKTNVEFFGSKTSAVAKIHSKIEIKTMKDATSRLSDIKEKVAMNTGKTIESDQAENKSKTETPNKSDLLVVEIGTAKEYPSSISPKPVVIKTSPKNVKATKVQDFVVPAKTETLGDIPKTHDIETQNEATSVSNPEIINESQNKDMEGSSDLKSVDDAKHEEKTEAKAVDTKIEVSGLNVNENETAPEVVISTAEVHNAEPIEIAIISVTDELKLDETEDQQKTNETYSPKIELTNDSSVKKRTVEKLENSDNDMKDKENNLNAANKPEAKVDLIIEQCSEEKNNDIPKITESVLAESVKTIKEEVKNIVEEKKEIKSPINETKTVNTKPAYSQAAAKPKSISAKSDNTKLPSSKPITSLTRSKTVVEINSSARVRNRQLQGKRIINNKCSYPFNLTTGRPSLFDGTPTSNAKTNLRNNRNYLKTSDRTVRNEDTSKRVPPKRPNNLRVEDSGAAVHKINESLEKIKDCENNSSTDTIVTQIIRNESSDSLKTLVPDPDYQFCEDLFANSIEVLNVDNQAENDNDGWLTVKSRRLSRESKKQTKSHWANRFNQPSATASLPTLNMIESPKQENKPIVPITDIQGETFALEVESIGDGDSAKLKNKVEKVNNPDSLENENCNITSTKDDPKQNRDKKDSADSKERQKSGKKMPKVNILEIKKPDHKSLKVLSTAIVRQKSDVTGLKSRTARNKSLAKTNKVDKQKDKIMPIDSESELTRNRLHSSLESLIPSGLSRSQESTEGSFDFDKWKFEFKNGIDFLEDEDRLLQRSEYLKTTDPVEMSEIALMTCEIEENERKISIALDFQSDMDQRKLCEEEDLLNRQIKELQQVSDVEFDTETDDTETDAEILCDDSQHLTVVSAMEDLGPLAASLEDQYEPVLAGLSWAERVDTLATLEALVARYPGRAQQLHAKLSQGIRRRGSLQETLKRYQLKQSRAEHQRLELQTERTNKIHQLLARVEDVKTAKNELIEEKRQRMEQRLQKAAENRDQYLKDIVRKAHDEEEKLREITFIKQLEAEHRRQDFLEQCRTHTARLRQMRRDRLRKLEEKAAREAAVGARRQALEQARAQHVSSLLERRRQRDARVVEQRERTRQRRDSAARQKAADVKSRLVALAAAADADAAALRSRIRHKQESTRERHAEYLQAIRTRALQPTRQHTTSEGQDAKPEEDQGEAPMNEPEVSREKLKAIRKKARKLKHKLLTAGQIFEDSAPVPAFSPLMMKNKMCRALAQLQAILAPVVGSVTPQVTQNGDHEHTPDLPDEPEKRKKKKRRKQSESVDDEKTAEIKDTKSIKSSKGNSICSSTSDLSRSARTNNNNHNNNNSKGALNLNQLDRALNELYRVMEKVDQVQNAPEKALFRQVNAFRPLSHILALAAARDPAEPPDDTTIQTKTVVTCVNTMMLAMYSGAPQPCLLVGTDALNSNLSVHAAQLLVHAADPPEEGSTSPLRKCLADFIATIFEVVKIKLRKAYEEQAVPPPTLLCDIRQRAFQLISFLSVSGFISHSPGDDLYRLVTLAVQLCTPLECDPPNGGDRCSAWQALRNALRPQLAGARAQFAALSVQPALPSVGETGRLVSLLMVAADRDRGLLQESFGDGGALEFSAAAARLLAAHAPPVDREITQPTHKPNKNQQCREQLAARQAEALVMDLIVIIGFFVVNNPAHQEAICGGSGGGGAVRLLCNLPAGWLHSEPHSRALLPTLAALAADKRAAERIASDLSLQMIEEYIQSPEAQFNRLVQLIHEGRAKQKSSKK